MTITDTNKMDSHFLSLIVPAYKQEGTILKDIKSLIEVLEEIRYDYEIIVVVDGEVDDTLKEIEKVRHKKLKVVSYKQNSGKFYAIRKGISKSRGDYVMFIDSGMEIDPNSISMLLEHMEWYEADIIVGSKRHPVSQVNYVWQRKILSYGYYYLIKLLFGLKIKDTQAGIKIFRKKVVEDIFPFLEINRFAGDLEMLVIANKMGHKRIYDAPIKLNYELASLSSAATLQSIRDIVKDTAELYVKHVLLRRKYAKKNG